MAVLSGRRLVADSGQERPRASFRTDLVTVLLAGWVLVGLMLDAWAHNNIPQLESFFTPWHAVFYTGFAATATWICWIVWRHVRAGRRGLAAVPTGYALAVVGLPIFALAGFGDAVWHTVFGVEQELKILFSPTHLVLATAMTLIATSPLRSAWANADLPEASPLRRLLPALLALAFTATGVLLFLQYANALIWSPRSIVLSLSNPHDGGPAAEFGDPVGLVTSIAVTNVVLLAPLLLLARRWRVPPGTATIVYVAVAALCAAITALRFPATLIAAVVAGICVDALLFWLRPDPRRRIPLLTFATLAPLVTWSIYLGFASYAFGRVPNIVEYWTGIPVVAALHGLLLGVLTGPQRTPTAVAD